MLTRRHPSNLLLVAAASCSLLTAPACRRPCPCAEPDSASVLDDAAAPRPDTGTDATADTDTADTTDAAPSDAPAPDVAGADEAQVGPTTTLTTDELDTPGPLGVGVVTLTLVDATRPTPPNGDYPGADSRTLVTEVWYPAAEGSIDDAAREAAPATTGAPYPLLLLSHGFASGRYDHAILCRYLVTHGYVVAAPDFPLTGLKAPGGAANPGDLVHQPADVRFVLDELLARGATPTELLGGLPDPERVGLAGTSLGGFTTLLAAYDPDELDPRVRAVVAMAAVSCFVPARSFDQPGPPLLVLHGDADALIEYQSQALPLFAAARPPKVLVTLARGTHTGMADVAAEILDALDHADEVGCAALGTVLGDDPDTTWPPVAWQSLGAPFLESDCALPCQHEGPLEGGMSTVRQVHLQRVAVRAFLDAHLRADAEADLFLGTGLGPQNEDVTVEVAP